MDQPAIKTKKAVFAGGEEKSNIRNINPATYGAGLSFYDFIGAGDVRAMETIRWYKKCMPFFRAIDARAEAFSSIPIRVKSRSNGQFVSDHPSLELLGDAGKPNPEDSVSDFKRAYSTWVDMSGESYLVACGMRDRPPVDIANAKPQDITLSAPDTRISGIYEVPATIRWNTNFFSERFQVERPAGDDKSFRYWNRDETKEIWQSGNFNPTASGSNLRGLSKASPISFEIQQFIEGNVNNLALLQRGARPSLAWVYSGSGLTDDQFEKWKEEARSYQGSSNTGRPMLVENFDVKNIGLTNVEMQFEQMMKMTAMKMYIIYGIPLAFTSPETMTLDNLKTSMSQLYDIAVLPHADNLLEQLTNFLMPRYENSEDLYFTYNTIDIEPLKERAIEQTSRLQKILILTDDELRSRVGYEELDEGGDFVWKPTNLLPSTEMDRFTADNRDQPGTGEKARVLESFVKHCREIKRSDGSRVYDDSQIELMAKEYNYLDEGEHISPEDV